MVHEEDDVDDEVVEFAVRSSEQEALAARTQLSLLSSQLRGMMGKMSGMRASHKQLLSLYGQKDLEVQDLEE